MAVVKVWPALGVEISADRSRTWIARAAEAEGRVVVELLPALTGSAGIAETISSSWSAWQVDVIGLDPSSPSATLIEPLTDVGMPLRLADARAMAVAHGNFRDLLGSDRLRARGDKALPEAVRQAQERRLAGAHAVERFGGPDLAPLVAAELAVWALLSDPTLGPGDVTVL